MGWLRWFHCAGKPSGQRIHLRELFVAPVNISSLEPISLRRRNEGAKKMRWEFVPALAFRTLSRIRAGAFNAGYLVARADVCASWGAVVCFSVPQSRAKPSDRLAAMPNSAAIMLRVNHHSETPVASAMDNVFSFFITL